MEPLVTEKEPEFAAFVAIDWADREHAWSMEAPGSRQRRKGKLEHTPEAIALGQWNWQPVLKAGRLPWPWSKRAEHCYMP
jgi:hypothetical protein